MSAFKLKAVEPLERDIQAAVLRYLGVDRRVGWCHRFNVGAKRVEGVDAKGRTTRRFIRFAFKGCSDILGQLIDGRFLAVECKRRGEVPSKEQAAFLASVEHFGGVAIVARSIDDVKLGLDAAIPLARQGDPEPLMHLPAHGIGTSALTQLLSRHSQP